MAFGLQVWDSSGSLVFDSTTAVGGVPIGVYTYSTGTTLSFPALAGATLQAIVVSGETFLGGDSDNTVDPGVTFSYASGYPVATVATTTNARTFMLAAF